MYKEIYIDEFKFKIYRKNIKHSYLRIDPRTGNISVSVSENTSDDFIVNFILNNMDWIKATTKDIEEKIGIGLPKINNAEEILIWGNKKLIKINYINKFPESCHLDKDKIILEIKRNRKINFRENKVKDCLRAELIKEAEILVEKWQNILNVNVKELRIKDMKTRWGTCNPLRSRIWINLKLIHLPKVYLEYIVVHEMMHLFERGHGEKFKTLMDKYYSNWREIRKELGNYIIS